MTTPLTINKFGYPEVKYTSSLKNHNATIELDTLLKQALISELNIDHAFPVEFASFLKTIEHELAKLDINTIIQQVAYKDWELLEQSGFFTQVFSNTEHQFVTVSCPLEHFAEAVMVGLGFEPPEMHSSE